MNDDIEIVAIHRARGEALLDTGEVFPIVQWIDDEGEEIDAPDSAIIAVGELPDGRFVVVDLRQFENTTFH